ALANRIRRIDPNGQISTFAGNGTAGFGGDGGGVSQSIINSPVGLVFDSNKGDLYIADSNNGRIRKVNASGVISTFMGCGTGAIDANCPAVTTLASGTQITPPTKARLFNPQSVSVGPDGIYVLDIAQTQSGDVSIIYR